MIILHIYLISTTFAFNFIDNLNLILRGYRLQGITNVGDVKIRG